MRSLSNHGDKRRDGCGSDLGGGKTVARRKHASALSLFASGCVDAGGGDPRSNIGGIEPNVVTDLVERHPSLCDETSDEPRPDVEYRSDLVDREQCRSVLCCSVPPMVLPHVYE
jgi:hypothetical protein